MPVAKGSLSHASPSASARTINFRESAGSAAATRLRPALQRLDQVLVRESRKYWSAMIATVRRSPVVRRVELDAVERTCHLPAR